MSNNKSHRKNKGGTWFLKIPDLWLPSEGIFSPVWSKKRSSSNILKVEVHGGPMAGYVYMRRRTEAIIYDRDVNINVLVYMNTETNKHVVEYVPKLNKFGKPKRGKLMDKHANDMARLIYTMDIFKL